MQFIFQYPVWFVVFCIALGLLYAGLLYYKTNDFTDETAHFRTIQSLLAFFRALVVSIISFLLLSPLVKTFTNEKLEPNIIIAHDNSESVKLGFAQPQLITYTKQLTTLKNVLSEKYSVDNYRFSSQIDQNDTLLLDGKSTNISNVLTVLNGNYFNKNVGALILASDGIYNEGIHPVYADFNPNAAGVPIYCIALGDTSYRKDLKISTLNANKIAYLGDKVQVDVLVESNALKGSVFNSILSNQGKTIANQTTSISENNTEHELRFIIDAAKIGLQKYTLSLSQLKGEVTYANNQYDFYIEVIDSRLKVLILANGPHPDIAALKQSINKNKNYDVQVAFIKNLKENISSYDLVILHQLPSKTEVAASVWNVLKKDKIPFLIIAGAATNFAVLNQDQSIVSVKPNANTQNDVLPYFNAAFNAFTLDEATQQKLVTFPPLAVPFGDYKPGTSSQVFLKQQIGAVETDFPLISFGMNEGIKNGLFIGEGLWRWRMYDFLENKNHDAFDEIISKTVQYLTVKNDKRRFRVNSTQNIYLETDKIQLDAEWYNESYELINKAEVTITLKNEKGEEFPYTFSKTEKSYRLELNSLPIGDYTYKASTNVNGKKYDATGAFSIKALQLEALQTRANHKVLYQLAEKTGGKVFFPHQMEDLAKLLLTKDTLKPILVEQVKTRSIIHLKGLFFLIISLLTVEWFARKYYGAY
jgi:hypothetical protein